MYSNIINKPRIVEIKRVEEEAENIKSLMFKDDTCSKASPGQFIMVWIPGIDEIPLSISRINKKDLSSITVKKIGDATTALHSLKLGDAIGIRGPYGRGFRLTEGQSIIVGGGIGMAPLVPLFEKLAKGKNKLSVVIGAKKKEELLFIDQMKSRISKRNVELYISTEDGSEGRKGFATDLAEEILKKQKTDMVYTCGPEEMINTMLLLSNEYKVQLQASLERFMRCAIGICGSCMIGKLRVCKDGPVFSNIQLEETGYEFGLPRRDASGKKEVY
jgi:dihydroorotate dehydrogenase electron transfer subunit